MTTTSCNNNTLFISRPTKDAAMQTASNPCPTSCLGVTDPVGCGKIGPRRSREKVREQIKDIVLSFLGAPVMKVELSEQNLDIAIDLALQVFEDYAPREYFTYYVFNTVPGKSIYTLPPDVGLVRNVFYKKQPSLTFNASDLGGALPIEYYYPGGSYASIQGGLLDPNQPIYGRMGEWVLYKQYEQMYSRLSSQIGGWEWIDGLCNIKLYPIPCRCWPVIVHYLQKKTDFKQVTQAMWEGALCFAKQMLGEMRRKYKQLPGPQGGVQLNGEELLREGIEGQEKWENRLVLRYGDILPITMDSWIWPILLLLIERFTSLLF
jgi:hypothetical protein